jgi:hypothetical protein
LVSGSSTIFLVFSLFGTNSLTVEHPNYLRIMQEPVSVPGSAKFSHIYGMHTISGSSVGWTFGKVQNRFGFTPTPWGQLLASLTHQLCILPYCNRAAEQSMSGVAP